MLRGHGGPTEPEHGVGTLGDLGTRRATLESPCWSLTSSQSPRHLDSPPGSTHPPVGPCGPRENSVNLSWRRWPGGTATTQVQSMACTVLAGGAPGRRGRGSRGW